ncbi:MAG TPA: MerC domain-containing protein [Terriglobales bacterium]|nr:MerC domain-containing protein [Terriglobales bacterium]
MQRYLRSLPADTLGISASGACMVHCALTPLLLALAPGLAHYVPGDEIVHRSLAALVLSAGALALVQGYRVHRKRIVLLGFAAGSMLVLAGATAGRLLGSHLAEIFVTVAGSASMVTSHWKNRAFCHACGKCSHK